MKKNIFKGLGALAVAALIAFNVNSSKSNAPQTASLASFTKTALADCESSTSWGSGFIVTYHSACSWTCSQGGSNACPL